jgi:hypothetical protein
MVESKDKLYWIIDHEELYWAPGKSLINNECLN